MKTLAKFIFAAAIATFAILLTQGCVTTSPTGRSPVKKVIKAPLRVRAVQGVIITKNAQPTATPTPMSRAPKPCDGKRSLGQTYDVVTANENADFYLYLCDEGASVGVANVPVTAYFAKVDEGGNVTQGPQLTSAQLKNTTGYFYGSTTLSILPGCLEGTRAQLKVRIKTTFLDNQPTGGPWPYMFVQACKPDGSGGCDPTGGLLIEVLPPL